MRVFQKDNNTVGVYDKFVYNVVVYACTPNSFALQNEYWARCKKPLKITNKLLCTKKKKDKEWIQRSITLVFAPEIYLRNHGYKEV